MKKLFIALLLLCLALTGCAKKEEPEIEEDPVIEEPSDINWKVTVYEEGDDVIWHIEYTLDDGEKQIVNIIYGFKDDKMVYIKNEYIFESEEKAQEAYKALMEGEDPSKDTITIEGNKVYGDVSENVVNYEEYTKASFFEMMLKLAEQA